MHTMVGTVCDRFKKLPSRYIVHNDWTDLLIDYDVAHTLNEIDIKNKEQEYKMLYGKK